LQLGGKMIDVSEAIERLHKYGVPKEQARAFIEATMQMHSYQVTRDLSVIKWMTRINMVLIVALMIFVLIYK